MCLACFSSPEGVNFLSHLLNESCSDVITVPLFFLASSQTTPRPLSSFYTHPRWQPVTHSARSRRSYGKMGTVNSLLLPHRNMHTGTKKRPTKSDIESVNKVISEVIHGFSQLTMPSTQAKIRLVSYERSQFNGKN